MEGSICRNLFYVEVPDKVAFEFSAVLMDALPVRLFLNCYFYLIFWERFWILFLQLFPQTKDNVKGYLSVIMLIIEP